MAVIQWGVPLALLAWFLWKARTNRLFLLGIPVLMVMRGSVFFQLMRPFWAPGRFDTDLHLMAWLTLVWAIIVFGRRRSAEGGGLRPFGAGRLLPEEIPLLFVAALMGVHILGVFATTGDLVQAVTAASGTIYLLVGYLFVRGIASRSTRAETLQFLVAVVVANTVAATMYVLHQGLHLPIYIGSEYYTTQFAGQEITRSFTFMPQFSLLALAFVLARREWNLKWLAVLGITLLAIMVSYTRALLIAAVVGIVVAVVAREFSKPDAGRFLRRMLAIVSSVVVVVLGLRIVRPVEFAYLVGRFNEFATANGASDIGNWQIRWRQFDAVYDFVAKNDAFLGLGYPEAGSNPIDAYLYRWSSDSTWVPIVYAFGLLGLALFGALLFGFAVRSLHLSLGPPEERRYLGLMFFTFIVLTVVMSFTRWTFTEPRLAAMGLWLLAFQAAEALRSDVAAVGELRATDLGNPRGVAGPPLVAAAGDDVVPARERGSR